MAPWETWNTAALAALAPHTSPGQPCSRSMAPGERLSCMFLGAPASACPLHTWNHSAVCKCHHRPLQDAKPRQRRSQPRGLHPQPPRTPGGSNGKVHPCLRKGPAGERRLAGGGRGGEGRISRQRGSPVRSCDRLGLLVPPRWQCQHTLLKYLAGLRSKH